MKPSAEEILGTLGGQTRVNYALDRIREALSSVGNPEQAVKSLVVAGTNGKGSTALFLSSALKEAGFKVGTYLSPHLSHPSERFLRGLRPIERTELDRLAQHHWSTAKRFDLTYFEFLTLLYFVWARDQGLDFSVLEVGLGGRLDATNVTTPLAVALPSIGRDHEKFLGSDLLNILKEKLAVVPPEGLLFSGISQPELRQEVQRHCDAIDAIYYHSDELRVGGVSEDWRGQVVTYNQTPFFLPSPGAAQRRNAATALLLLRILFPRYPLSTWQRAFAKVRHPGRWETVSTSPRVILSGDHNPAGLEATAEWVREQCKGKLYVVCAFSPDKPYQQMHQTLRDQAEATWLTHWTDCSDDYKEMGRFCSDPDQAVEQALAHLTPADTLWITGSLYLVGRLRPRWRKEVAFEIDPKEAQSPSSPSPAPANPVPVQRGEEVRIPVPPGVLGERSHRLPPTSESHIR